MTAQTGIYAALAKINTEVKSIGKDSINKSQGFNYRGIDAVLNNLHPLFAKHGVIILPRVMTERSEERESRGGGVLIYRILTTAFHFVASDGSEVVSTIVSEGMDSGDKAANKALAIGLKNALTQMFLLPYDEVDPDAESHEIKPKEKPQEKPRETAKAPASAAPTSKEMTEQTAIGVLAHITKKEGINKNNKPYVYYTLEMEDGTKYGTFDTAVGDEAEALKGECVVVHWYQNGKYRNATKVLLSGDAAEPAIPGDDNLNF